MNKEIVIIETTNISPHLETSFEIAKDHLDNGDHVSYLFVGGALEFTEFFKKGGLPSFFAKSPQRRGSLLLKHENFSYQEFDNQEVMLDFEVPSFEDLNSLGNFEYRSFKAGMATLSSLISFTRNSKPILSEHSDLVGKILLSSISLHEFTLKYLTNNNVDLVYLFNGRFANSRAILDAAIATMTPYMVHERGSSMFKYSIRPFIPHDSVKIGKEMLEAWNNSDIDLDHKIISGSRFFEDRRNGIEQSWTSFVRGQIKGKGLSDIKGKRLISFFSSSDDEFASVGDVFKWDRWPNQIAAFKDLLKIISSNDHLFLALRIHPSMSQKGRGDLEEWLNLPLPVNSTVILPEDNLDSYKLMEQSDVVITGGSTMGIEAVYWNKPSICLGPSFYSHLNCVHLPNDIGELESLLLSSELGSEKIKALPYGFYMSTFGIRYKYYKPDTLFEGSFLGSYLDPYINVIQKLKGHLC